MTEKRQIYKCNYCGNIVEVLHEGVGELVCCNKPMELMKENTVDASLEKHVPVIERNGSQVTVKVGSVEHPMEESHYIEWIELYTDQDKKAQKVFLKPGDKPVAEFTTTAKKVTAREYCNLHKLWKAEG